MPWIGSVGDTGDAGRGEADVVHQETDEILAATQGYYYPVRPKRFSRVRSLWHRTFHQRGHGVERSTQRRRRRVF